MKIILIAQAYPPYPIVGALRAQKIARAFRDAGHRVEVVTERLGDEKERQRVVEPGITVHAVALGPKYRERVTGALRRLRRRGAARPVVSGAAAAAGASAAPPSVSGGVGGPGRAGGATGWLRRFALAVLWLPDDEQRFIRPALQAARAVLDGVELVYTTAPPWSSHLVGLALRRRHGIRWAADFRDPWLEIIEQTPEHPRTGATDAILRRVERAILRHADHVVVVAARTRDAFAAKLPVEQRDKVVLARNGVDVVAPAREARTPGPLRIAYAGAVYDDRDPRLFLTALARVRAERGLTPDDVRVDFVGACRMLGDVSIERYVRDLGLDDVVHFQDWMPQAEAWRLLATADLLLILSRGMRLQVPNKLYEYLGLRIPIFAWADPDGETAEVLRTLPGHFVVTGGTEAEMAARLASALDEVQPAASSEAQNQLLDAWSVRRQMDHLVATVAG